MATGREEMGECGETEKQAGRGLADAMHIMSVNSKTSFSITFCYPRVTTWIKKENSSSNILIPSIQQAQGLLKKKKITVLSLGAS